MNRHKLYWSAMGIEPSNEPSKLPDIRKADKEKLYEMINQYSNVYNLDGYTEVLSLFREIHSELGR